jgi:hypothetical protein
MPCASLLLRVCRGLLESKSSPLGRTYCAAKNTGPNLVRHVSVSPVLYMLLYAMYAMYAAVLSVLVVLQSGSGVIKDHSAH